MATRALVREKARYDEKFSWAGILTTDDGAPAPIKGGKYAGIAQGTFGVSPSLAWNYSPDGVTYTALANPHTAAGVVVYDLPDGFIKPVMGGGDGTTNLAAYFRPISH